MYNLLLTIILTVILSSCIEKRINEEIDKRYKIEMKRNNSINKTNELFKELDNQ